MYKVYATAPNADQITVFEFLTMDNAIRCCFDLSAQAHQIDKVTLPSGNEVKGERVIQTMSAGVRATRVFLKYDHLT